MTGSPCELCNATDVYAVKGAELILTIYMMFSPIRAFLVKENDVHILLIYLGT